jgi:two-component system, OmpR family, alkaline phosphatase synthesis response regulator PhoP
MHKILIVEDEPHLSFNLELRFKGLNYSVLLAENGQDAISLFDSNPDIAVVLLDITIPEPNGFTVGSYMRQRRHDVAILFLTARSQSDDRLRGLTIGADDYILKPFQFQELELKVKRCIDRTHNPDLPKDEVVHFKGIRLDKSALTLDTSKGRFEITDLEAKIIDAFIKNKNRVLSREYLLKSVWGIVGSVETRTVDHFISRIRRFFEADVKKPKVLRSVRGQGYSFNEKELE